MSEPPRLALVTGGHRRLGARIAMQLARSGYAIAVHGRHDADPHPLLARCLAEAGSDWAGFIADFLVPGEAEALIPAIMDHFGRAPDLLVNSASAFGQDRLETVTANELAEHFAVNASTPILLTQAFARADRPANADASIVNILDQRLAQPHGDQLAYTVGKFALEGFTRIAARELAPRIRVNAVAPGLTLATDDYSPAQLERLGQAMPLGRLADPDDIGRAVLYLASTPAVTGQTLYVDAGAHMISFDRDFMYLAE